MEITFEIVFIVVQALITGILGAVLKGKVIPSYLIPVQNIVLGILAGLVSVYFGLFADIPTALIISLMVSLGVGGAYDAFKSITTTKTVE